MPKNREIAQAFQDLKLVADPAKRREQIEALHAILKADARNADGLRDVIKQNIGKLLARRTDPYASVNGEAFLALAGEDPDAAQTTPKALQLLVAKKYIQLRLAERPLQEEILKHPRDFAGLKTYLKSQFTDASRNPFACFDQLSDRDLMSIYNDAAQQYLQPISQALDSCIGKVEPKCNALKEAITRLSRNPSNTELSKLTAEIADALKIIDHEFDAYLVSQEPIMARAEGDLQGLQATPHWTSYKEKEEQLKQLVMPVGKLIDDHGALLEKAINQYAEGVKYPANAGTLLARKLTEKLSEAENNYGHLRKLHDAFTQTKSLHGTTGAHQRLNTLLNTKMQEATENLIKLQIATYAKHAKDSYEKLVQELAEIKDTNSLEENRSHLRAAEKLEELIRSQNARINAALATAFSDRQKRGIEFELEDEIEATEEFARKAKDDLERVSRYREPKIANILHRAQETVSGTHNIGEFTTTVVRKGTPNPAAPPAPVYVGTELRLGNGIPDGKFPYQATRLEPGDVINAQRTYAIPRQGAQPEIVTATLEQDHKGSVRTKMTKADLDKLDDDALEALAIEQASMLLLNCPPGEKELYIVGDHPKLGKKVLAAVLALKQSRSDLSHLEVRFQVKGALTQQGEKIPEDSWASKKIHRSLPRPEVNKFVNEELKSYVSKQWLKAMQGNLSDLGQGQDAARKKQETYKKELTKAQGKQEPNDKLFGRHKKVENEQYQEGDAIDAKGNIHRPGR